MKKISIFLLIFVIHNNLLSSQTTADLFSVKGLKYGILYEDSYSANTVSNQSHYYDGDTVINDLKLLRFVSYSNPYYKDYLAVDDRKVYYFDDFSKTSILLYDFSLALNDTFSSNFNKYIVQKREIKIYLDGKSRVYLQLKSINSDYTLEWIEGIGDINLGTFYKRHIHPGDLRFVCASSDDGIIYINDRSEFVCDSSMFCKAAFGMFTNSNNGPVVNFYNHSLHSVSQLWDFGDGISSTHPNPSHQYDSPGCKEVTLRSISACGDTSYYSKGVNYCMKGDWQISKKLDINGPIYDMNIINEHKMWVTTRNTVLYSVDGGITFENITPSLQPNSRILKLFYNDTVAVLLVEYRLDNNKTFDVYYSKDSGRSWIITARDTGNFAYLYHHYSSNVLVYTINRWNGNLSYISIDNGKKWNEIIIPNFTNNHTLEILDNSTIVFTYSTYIDNQEQSFLSFSRDLGANWEDHPILNYHNKYSINENLSFLYTTESKLLVSNDLFKTYREIYQFLKEFVPFRIIFLDSLRGFVSNREQTFFTLDGGKTWLKTNCEKQFDLQLVKDQRGGIFGYENNEIYSFSPPEIDLECLDSILEEPYLKNLIIYPNPILEGNMVEISNFNLSTEFYIDVFNAYGKHMIFQNLDNNMIDTSRLSKGIYFVQIRDKSSTISIKTTLIII
ncbi:MAG: T9SS type A sorting domain-containing protein [Saprospiraceae bacterium]|nr:T9SS type A sorting domain-containing protein [Saprospiraceae bacterium]